MSAKNADHDAVKAALEADGWAITHDPLRLRFGGRNLLIDLGAEQTTLAAEKEGRRIAVEIQSLLGPSPVRALEEAVGQYQVYKEVLAENEPDRALYMAASRLAFANVFGDAFGGFFLKRLQLRVIVYEPEPPRIVQWIG